MDRSWKSHMLQTVDEVCWREIWLSRRRKVLAIYLKLANYERQELVSFLLELCLWKTKIDEVGANGQAPDREFCRVNSGTSVVIPHVLSFLDDELDVEGDYLSLRDPTSLRVDRFSARCVGCTRV
eukprot:scaffold2594_cov85-Cylindrotheca_fusiformis.AAC.3